MTGKIDRFFRLFKIYGFHAFRLIGNPLLGLPVWIPLNGRKVWLNFDGATYYHLIHSFDKLKNLVASIPRGTQGAIIDGGANHGLFSLLASQRFPEAAIYALEPYQHILPVLKKNLTNTQVNIIEKALAAEDGEVAFYSTPFSDQMGSAIRKNIEEFLPKGSAIAESRVPAVSLSTFVKEQGIERIAALKLDVQGLEYAILKNADEVLEKTDCLLLEVMLLEQTSLELLEKARKHFPYFKALNPIAFGADLVFTKTSMDADV